MDKVLAILTALVTVIAVVMGLASYLGSVAAERYHLVTGMLALVLVLVTTHRLYYGAGGRK